MVMVVQVYRYKLKTNIWAKKLPINNNFGHLRLKPKRNKDKEN